MALGQIPEFKKFLEAKGWTIQDEKGIWECLRATREGSKTIVIYFKSQTLAGGQTQHATMQSGCPSQRLVREWIQKKKRGPDGK